MPCWEPSPSRIRSVKIAAAEVIPGVRSSAGTTFPGMRL